MQPLSALGNARVVDLQAAGCASSNSTQRDEILEVNQMKIFKLIGVVAVIGIGLLANTVHAQVNQARVVQLDCIPGNAVFGCGAEGIHGKVTIHLSQTGSSASGAVNHPFFTLPDGEPRPNVDLDVYAPCQNEIRGGIFTGPRQFYVLYITLIPSGLTKRIISFNTHCVSFHFSDNIGLPILADPTDWLTEDLSVKVVLEADDGVDITLPNGVLLVGTDTACTVACIVNGTFETGDLTGWTGSGINGGFAVVVQEGMCFSFNNTTGLTFNGDFAADVRSGGPGGPSSIGILTSDLFVAGSGISFRALSENDDGVPAADPVTLEVRVLDGGGNVLLSQIVTTNIVTLNDVRCPGGEPRDGIFSTHIVDTSALAGQAVRVEFRQHTDVPGRGFFTLIDDVAVNP